MAKSKHNRSQIAASLFVKQLQYSFIFFNQFFFTPLGICRAGAWQAMNGKVVAWFIYGRAFFLPEVVGGFAGADYVVNLAVFQNFCEVIWDGIFYA